MPELLIGILVRGPGVLFHHLSPPALSHWLQAIVMMAALACIAGSVLALRSSQSRARMLWCLLHAGVALVLLAALRSQTPYYMAQCWLPFAAAVCALAWWQLGRRMLLPLACAVSFSAMAGPLLLVRQAEQGRLVLPASSVSDVRRPGESAETPIVPAWRLARFGAGLCDAKQRVVLHGAVGIGYDSMLGLGGRIACGVDPRIGIGGGGSSPDAAHLLGLTPHQLRRIGIADHEVRWSQALRLAPDRVVAAPESVALALGDRYPFRDRQESPPSSRTYRFQTAATDIVISNELFGAYAPSRALALRADGHAPVRLLEDAVSEAWRCDACAEDVVTWEITLHGPAAMADLLVVDPVRLRRELGPVGAALPE